MLDLIIKNGQCYINGKLEDKDIAVKDGKILKIGEILEEAKEVYDAKKQIAHTWLNLNELRFVQHHSQDQKHQ